MKKTLIVAAIALITAMGMTLNASAQGPRGQGQGMNAGNCPVVDCPACLGGAGMGKRGPGGGRMAMMNGLNLSDTQRAQVRDIMIQQREETHAKIRTILTPEQQAAFDARKAQRDAWFEQRMGW
jgi:Spy/CpxP family protein refolding chaperone